VEIINQGFDHVEFVVNDARPMGMVFQRMGFEKLGERELPDQGTKTVAYGQGYVRILVTQPTGAPRVGAATEVPHSIQFLRNHAEGICVLALDVKDATQAYEVAVKRGARSAREPQTFKTPEGTVTRSEIWTPADVRYAFIQRHAPNGPNSPALFDEGLVVSRLESPSPLGIRVIDHLTNNVGMGEMKDWVEYYKEIFGFIVTRHFDIRTGRTGLISDVVESPDHRVKVPINEATEKESQVQEFVNRMKGPGVQHLALLTVGIQDTLTSLRKQNFKFLSVPHTYYEEVPTRVPGVTENLNDLEELGVLLDGDKSGYLLQIFSEEILGPFFFEYIQRKGNHGFGEGNFRALFEAIERDQIKRGVLKA
jgi:4-hydroxyphenylpyruvate dioxygenase